MREERCAGLAQFLPRADAAGSSRVAEIRPWGIGAIWALAHPRRRSCPQAQESSITCFTKDVFYWLLLNMQGQRRLGQRSIHILYRVFRWNNQLDVQYCVHNNYSYINQYCFIVDNYLFLISLFTCSLSFHTSLDIWTTIATMTLNIHYQSILADIVYVSIFLQSHSVYVLLYTETIYGIYSLWLILVVIPLE